MSDTFKVIAVILSVALGGGAAWAQSTADAIRDLVFSEAEKRLIGEHFGVDVQDMVQNPGMPDWAVKNADQDDDQNDDDDAENDDRDDDGDKAKSGKKDKGAKNKNKGKSDKGNGKSKGLPPGLAKRDSLPPGLQKQLDKNGRLPPGLAKRDLPSDLAAKLPKRDDSQDVTIVEDDVVLIDKTTGVILDVIKDVVRGRSGKTAAEGGDGSLAPPPGNGDTSGSSGSGSVLDSVLKTIFGGGS